VTLRAAIAYPACSPTRATVESAAYGFRTGIGRIVREGNPVALGPEDSYLARHTRGAGRRAAFVGKWHLAPENRPEHAATLYPDFAGTATNLWPGDYFEWEKIVGSAPRRASGYVTSDTIDDALARWSDGADVLVISLNAVHKPLHVPPRELFEGDYELDTKLGQARAMLEAADTELGRFLRESGLDLERDLLVVLSDNGTTEVLGGGKKELSHAGVNVPLWIAGPGATPGLVSDALVGTVDVAPTVLDVVLGEAPPARDGRSLRAALAGGEGPRRYAYAEKFHNGPPPIERWTRMLFDGRWKLIEEVDDGARELFDLRRDPEEEHDLLADGGPLSDEARAALARLAANWPE
jgi:arylsulfatase A-like enzyme